MSKNDYHVQYQAIEAINTIPPVPNDYPLKQGISEKFRVNFVQLIELVKNILCDMAKTPESYGFLLLPITETKGLTDSMNSMRKPLDALYALACAGELAGNNLCIHIPTFKELVKQAKPGKLTGYNLILNRLGVLGFAYDGWDGKAFHKEQTHFTVSFPSNIAIISALKIFADCCAEHQQGRYGTHDFTPYRLFSRLDYKYTADMDKIPEIQWIRDQVHSWEDDAKAFYIAFYEEALKNPKIKWDIDFFKGKKPAAVLTWTNNHRARSSYITEAEYRDILHGHLGGLRFSLHLYLPLKGDSERFDNLPPHVIEYMKTKKCQNCDVFLFKKAKNGGICPHNVYWAHNGVEQTGCSWHCFDFEELRIEDIPAYCSVL